MTMIPSADSLTGKKTRKIFENGREVEIDYIEKDPDTNITYAWDWYDGGNGWLDDTLLIASSAWTIDSDLTDETHPTPINAANRVANVELSGGTVKTWEDYENWPKVSNQITTNGTPSESPVRTFYVWVREL